MRMPFYGPKRGGRRKTDIQAAKISVQGQAHLQDGVPNQDAAFQMIKPAASAPPRGVKKKEELGLNDFGIFIAAVFDGHGPKGEAASVLGAERMSDTLHRILSHDPGIALKEAAGKAFAEVAATLNSAECGAHSGTTGSVALIRDDDLVVAHVGDSAVIVISAGAFGKSRIKYMSPFHRPSEENEAQRIKECGGLVLQGYVLDPEAKNGLAVSRTLGDRDMQGYGCISEPHVQQLQLSKNDCAIILASDGFWDHEGLELEQVVKIVARLKRRRPKEICEKLLEMARSHGEPTDDCTIACLTLN